MERPALLILNPASGRGRARALADSVVQLAASEGFQVELRMSSLAGEEVELAARGAEQGWPLIVAVGGDGTVHGVANGILDSGRDTLLGLIPVGTGNDFAQTTGMGRYGPRGALRQLARGEVRRFDVGRALGEHFLNGAGVGIGPAVLASMPAIRWLRGSALYLAATVRAFKGFRPIPVEVMLDGGRIERQLIMAEVALGRTAGGGFRLTPQADPCDGQFDVCLIEPVSWMEFLRYLPRVLAGTHASLPPVTIQRSGRVTLRSEAPLSVHLDGELRDVPTGELEIELLPGRLSVICAASS